VATLNGPVAPDSQHPNQKVWADRAWQLYVALGGLATIVYLLAGASAGKRAYFTLVTLSSVVAILTGIRLHRPRRPLPWYLFAAGIAMFALGDAFYYTLPQLLHRSAPGFPSTGDVFYLLVYPFLIAGVMIIIRQRNPGRDALGLIDALIVTLALGLVAWVFLIVPYARDPTLSLGRKVISMAYPLMDVLLLGVAARLALDRGNRRPVFHLLILSMLCLLAADTIYGLIVLHGTYNTGSPLDALWIAFYVGWGAAALHPSMRTLSEPGAVVESRLTGWRVVLLVGATLVAPMIQVADSSLGYAPAVLVVGDVAIVTLVIIRTAGLIRRYEGSLRREGALREAGVAMAAAGSRVEILAAAREAVQTLVGKGAAAHLYLVDASGEILPLPHLQPATASSSPIFVADLPPATKTALALREWTTGDAVKAFSTMFEADHGGTSTSMYPFIVTNDLRAVVLVSGERAIPDGIATSVSVLVSQVVLALEREQLAEQIHRERSEARFRSLVQMATDVVTIVGVDATILYLSPSVERVLGYPPDGLIGTSLVALAHPDDGPVALALAAPTGGTDRSDAVEWRVLHADGSWKYLETIKTNLLDDPNVGGLVLNSRDVSERKRAEEDRELLRGRLHQAQRLEAIGQLAAGVAHDFNNLLAVILIYANFVTKRVEAKPGHPPVAEDLVLVAADTEKIRLAAERAAALTHQLLIFGRRGDMEPKVLDLNEVVADLQELLGRTIGEHITLRIRLDPALSAVRIDPSAIYQVVMNLVINARDAMALGGTLTIETVNVEFDRPLMWGSDLGVGNYVRLRVTDTGCGMPAGVAARAFEPFFTTKPTGEGSGLGLATVYGIVKQAEGDVRLYSEPDHGTVITVYLPATSESITVPAEEPAPVPQVGIRTILVVEDEDDVREGISRLLADHAYNVVSAPDGAEALRMVADFDGAIDLLLTDLVMPGMSGGELAATLLNERPGIGVLFMSGYPQSLSEEGYAPATEGVLSKPFTERRLLQAVRESIASPEAGGPQ
jgi:PAS domain S-box-containing protein